MEFGKGPNSDINLIGEWLIHGGHCPWGMCGGNDFPKGKCWWSNIYFVVWVAKSVIIKVVIWTHVSPSLIERDNLLQMFFGLKHHLHY